jgi:Asp/Glu/hydantoin racemase
MVDHGAKNLAFFSRSGATKSDAKALIDKLTSDGIRAVAYACDIGDPAQVERAMEQCKKDMPPIRGIIQAAMSLAVSLTLTFSTLLS